MHVQPLHFEEGKEMYLSVMLPRPARSGAGENTCKYVLPLPGSESLPAESREPPIDWLLAEGSERIEPDSLRSALPPCDDKPVPHEFTSCKWRELKVSMPSGKRHHPYPFCSSCT
jgi:hypothetical protein